MSLLNPTLQTQACAGTVHSSPLATSAALQVASPENCVGLTPGQLQVTFHLTARCCDQGRHHFRLPSHPTKTRFSSSLRTVSYRKPGVNPAPPSCGKVATYASTPVAPVLKATTVGPSGNTEEHSYVFRQTMGSLQMCAEGLRFGVIAVSTQWRESRVWSRLPLGAGDCASRSPLSLWELFLFS